MASLNPGGKANISLSSPSVTSIKGSKHHLGGNASKYLNMKQGGVEERSCEIREDRLLMR